MSRLTLLAGLVLLAVLVAATAVATLAARTPNRGGVSLASLAIRKSAAYTLTYYKKHDERFRYTISGNATKTLSPGTSSTIDLSLRNPNSKPITIPAGAIAIAIISTRRDCPAYRNFEVAQTLTSSVTIPGNDTTTLSELRVPSTDWPAIRMKDTSFTQDACAGMTLYLRYSSRNGHGHGHGRRRWQRPPHVSFNSRGHLHGR